MDANFWLEKWKKNEIAFHESEANPLLVKYFSQLNLESNSRVFVPLCGKTFDISWLLSNGYRVVGAELSKIAIDQLFMQLGAEPKIINVGAVEHYSAENIDIFVGDFFCLSRQMLGSVDAIYDRAALVALPAEIRNQYTKHLTDISKNASQLLICYDYDQALLEGPPFSIGVEEVKRQYSISYEINFLTSQDVNGGLKGKCPAKENVLVLKKI